MDRRKVLLAIAVVLATVGVLVVFVYVQNADDRAASRYDSVEVLTAAQQIEPGESVADAAAAGKFARTRIPSVASVNGHLSSTDAINGQVATTRIYPGQQLLAPMFGTEASTSVLQIPEGQMAISVQLSDTARVAGFVNPGSEVAVFYNGPDPQGGQPFNRMLLRRVTVLGVGSTTPVNTTTTDASGSQTTEALPRTLFTLALDQADAQKVMYATANGELSFALLTEDSTVVQAPGVNGQTLFR